MTALLSMLQSNASKPKSEDSDNGSGVQEDALLAVSSLVDVLGERFLKYLDSLLPCLVPCLMSMHDTQVCFNAIGLVTDLYRNLGKHMLPHTQGVFQLLMTILQDSSVDKSLRPAIIDVFSDFSIALGAEVDPFLLPMLEILQTATQANVDVNDPDMVDYLLQLRASCLEAYIGILHGLKDDPNTRQNSYEVFMAQTPYVIQFITHVCEDFNVVEEIITHSCGLIGDFVGAYGVKMLPLVDNESISKILSRGRRGKNQRTRNYATWATKEIKKLQSAMSGNADSSGLSASGGTLQPINVGQR
ncbi:Importin subunit beta-1 [Cichlidogyrus casuarinus]|uniref:Importin subunit beta-1 n=1 Tax=Cichlidogyrus casuarinus TaxID=1844966 RepID=A0ABD2PU05_9PLAT